jgi:plasmid stabilization system protein ParE
VRVRWTLDAANDLEEIHSYLAATRPELMRSTVLHLYTELTNLRKFPLIGRKAIRPGLRELFFWPLPYVCTYRVDENAIIILRIHHTAKDRPVQ